MIGGGVDAFPVPGFLSTFRRQQSNNNTPNETSIIPATISFSIAYMTSVSVSANVRDIAAAYERAPCDLPTILSCTIEYRDTAMDTTAMPQTRQRNRFALLQPGVCSDEGIYMHAKGHLSSKPVTGHLGDG